MPDPWFYILQRPIYQFPSVWFHVRMNVLLDFEHFELQQVGRRDRRIMAIGVPRQ
jgi:hypothetical protein